MISHNLPILMIYLLKVYFDSSNKDQLLNVVIGFSALFLLRLVLIRVGAKADIRAQQMWSNTLYDCLIDKVKKKASTGKIESEKYIDIIQNDISAIVGTISYAIDTFSNVLGTIIAFVIMATINIYVSAIILVVPIILFFISNSLKNRIYKKSEVIRGNEASILRYYQYMIGSSRDIRIESKEEECRTQYEKLLRKNKEDKVKYSNFKSFLAVINEFMVDINVVVILLGFMFSDSFTAGDIALFISYSFIINDLSTYISTFTILYSELGVYIDSFNKKVMLDENKIVEKSGCEDKMLDKSEYVKGKILAGRVNVLIGKNGSGKTSILKKLAMLDDYVLVMKNSSVISESLKANIMLDGAYHDEGKRAFNNSSKGYHKDDMKYKACSNDRYERIIETFSLEGLDDRDVLIEDELSGGQIDRIAVARSIMEEDKIVMIDKNLLSIDRCVRDSIMKELERLDLTVLVVDHNDKDEYNSFNKIFI